MKFAPYLEKITGVSIYPMLSLIIFTTVFIGVIIMVARMSNETIKEMEELPLDNDN